NRGRYAGKAGVVEEITDTAMIPVGNPVKPVLVNKLFNDGLIAILFSQGIKIHRRVDFLFQQLICTTLYFCSFFGWIRDGLIVPANLLIPRTQTFIDTLIVVYPHIGIIVCPIPRL